jgi:hypothetical protein
MKYCFTLVPCPIGNAAGAFYFELTREPDSGQAEVVKTRDMGNAGRLSADDQPATIDLESWITCDVERGTKCPTVSALEVRTQGILLPMPRMSPFSIAVHSLCRTTHTSTPTMMKTWSLKFTFRNAHTCLWAGVAQSVCLTKDWTTGVQTPAEGKDFSSSLCIQISSEAHPASCPVGTRGPVITMPIRGHPPCHNERPSDQFRNGHGPSSVAKGAAMLAQDLSATRVNSLWKQQSVTRYPWE